MADIKEVVFENPAGDPRQVRHVGPITVALNGFKRNVALRRHVFTLNVSYDPFEADKEWKESLARVPLVDRILHRVRTPGSPGFTSTSFRRVKVETAYAEWRGELFSDVAPKALVVRVATKTASDRISFMLKDIPLPGAP